MADHLMIEIDLSVYSCGLFLIMLGTENDFPARVG